MTRISASRSLRFLTVAIAAAAVLGLGFLSPAGSAKADSTYTLNLTVHYFRADGNYSNPWGAGAANLWSWDNASGSGSCTGAGVNPPNNFTGKDSFGVYGTISFTCPTSSRAFEIGYIVRDNSWNKDTPNNRYQDESYGSTSTNSACDVVNDNSNTVTGQASSSACWYPTGGPVASATYNTSVWVLSGDTNNYYSLAAANYAKFTQIQAAAVAGKHSVLVTLNKSFALTNIALKGEDWTLKPLGKLAKGEKKSYAATAQADGEKYPGLDAVVVGTVQSAAGDPGGDWNPASTYTKMKQVSGDLYEYSKTLPAGDYQYKVNVGGAWSCGTCWECTSLERRPRAGRQRERDVLPAALWTIGLGLGQRPNPGIAR